MLKLSIIDQGRGKEANTRRGELPTVDGRVDELLVRTLVTVCAKLYDPSLHTVFKPADGSEPDKKLEQPYELVKKGGQYKEGGNYTADGVYTNGKGALVSGYDVFNKDTTQVVGGKSHGTASLASYGTVIDGFTDFHGEDQAAIPPFAALIVQPKVDDIETIFSWYRWRVVRQAVRSTTCSLALPPGLVLLKECCPLLFLFPNC